MIKISMRNLFAVISLIFFGLSLSATYPAGYYNSIEGKSLGQLKTAVSNVINTLPVQNERYYYDVLPQHFSKTDVRPNTSPQQWWDMYSSKKFYIREGMKGLNREHSFPKSWWGGGQDVPAYTDLNHLYPSERNANMKKSNYPLGEVKSSSFDNGVSKVGTAVYGQGGGASNVFEPADEYKGDFARTYFYMVTCYQNLTWKYTYMVGQNTYPTLVPWAQELLLRWSREDPVSQKEIDRNEQVYALQGNRNPFIDLPELCEYIWGNKKGQVFTLGDEPITGDPELEIPTDNSIFDMGQATVNNEISKNLKIKGKNFIQHVTVTIYSGDAKYFKCVATSIPGNLINSKEGYLLPIHYKPTELGEHSTKLVISDGGMTGSIIVNIKGESVESGSVTDVEVDKGYEVIATESGELMFRCLVPQTNCQIFSASGVLVKTIAEVQDCMTVNLPMGVYIIRTAENLKPVKVIVR